MAIWPRLIAAGATDIRWADSPELCRRLFLDLVGAIPTPAEYAEICDGQSAAAIADALMASPRFVARERRLWIQELREDPLEVKADHLADADRILDALALGEIGYDDFAARLLAHPVMAINRSIDTERREETADHAFRTFLGRAPSANELGDMVNLLRVWERHYVPRYDEGYGYYVRVAFLDPGGCDDPVYGPAACTSTWLGAPTTIALPLAGELPYEEIEGAVPTEIATELEKPGRLLATRAEFWDRAADRSLARFVGWWKSSLAEPDTDVPEVRAALASWFRATPDADIRDLYRMIVTSVLYARSARAKAPDPAAPPWTIGPTRTLDPEQFLDSLAVATGRTLGFCDPHTDEPVGRDFFWPDRLRTPQPDDFYGFERDFYRESAVALGGCQGGIPSPIAPGMPALLAHMQLARTLCAAPSEIAPPGHDPRDTSADAIAELAAFQFQRLVSRPPSDRELAAVTTAVTACAASPADCNLDDLPGELCGALVRSSAFLTY